MILSKGMELELCEAKKVSGAKLQRGIRLDTSTKVRSKLVEEEEERWTERRKV